MKHVRPFDYDKHGKDLSPEEIRDMEDILNIASDEGFPVEKMGMGRFPDINNLTGKLGILIHAKGYDPEYHQWVGKRSDPAEYERITSEVMNRLSTVVNIISDWVKMRK